MTGQPSDQREDGLHFAQQVKVIPTGGTMEASGNGIKVTGADEIVILTSSGTNYQQCMDDTFDYFSEEDPLDAIAARIAAAEEKGYEQLKEEHIADYTALFDAAEVNFGTNEVPDKTTDNLLAGYDGRSGNPNTAAEDLYLENMFFQYGRYLLIASSREGSLPQIYRESGQTV